MSRLKTTIIAATSAAMLAACGGDEAPEMRNNPTGQPAPADDAATNSPPEIVELVLRPSQPRPGDMIHAEARARDEDGDHITFHYAWMIDGRDIEDSGSSLRPDDLGKGAVIEVVVTARDGFEASEPLAASVRLGNQPPMLLGVAFQPKGELRGDRDISARPHATDPDGDTIDYSYAWWVNDTPKGEDDPVLHASHFGRGDEIVLVVVASDGVHESAELRTDPISVQNAPPHIASTPGGFGTDGIFRYRIQVEDADGDSRFGYRLIDGPEGMVIDSLDGLMLWHPRESQAGVHMVKLEVDDRRGGKATQSFKLELAFEETAVPAAGNW